MVPLVLAATFVLPSSLSQSGDAVNKRPAARRFPVQMEVSAGKVSEAGRQTLEVALAFEPDWEAIGNPAGLKGLEPGQTLLEVTGRVPLKSVRVRYPAGVIRKSPLGGDYRIYRGRVVLRAEVERAAGDAGPLEVTVWVRPFNRVLGVCRPLEVLKKSLSGQ